MDIKWANTVKIRKKPLIKCKNALPGQFPDIEKRFFVTNSARSIPDFGGVGGFGALGDFEYVIGFFRAESKRKRPAGLGDRRGAAIEGIWREKIKAETVFGQFMTVSISMRKKKQRIINVDSIVGRCNLGAWGGLLEKQFQQQ